jgi:hypothetical protein
VCSSLEPGFEVQRFIGARVLRALNPTQPEGEQWLAESTSVCVLPRPVCVTSRLSPAECAWHCVVVWGQGFRVSWTGHTLKTRHPCWVSVCVHSRFLAHGNASVAPVWIVPCSLLLLSGGVPADCARQCVFSLCSVAPVWVAPCSLLLWVVCFGGLLVTYRHVRHDHSGIAYRERATVEHSKVTPGLPVAVLLWCFSLCRQRCWLYNRCVMLLLRGVTRPRVS